jgi:hypothetical protein
MFRRKQIYWIVLTVLVVWVVYVYANREHFIAEHMTVEPTLDMVDKKVDDVNDKVDKLLPPEEKPVPTLYSVDKRVDETNQKLDDLITKFESQNKQMQAQVSQAEAAKAALQAIPRA